MNPQTLALLLFLFPLLAHAESTAEAGVGEATKIKIHGRSAMIIPATGELRHIELVNPKAIVSINRLDSSLEFSSKGPILVRVTANGTLKVDGTLKSNQPIFFLNSNRILVGPNTGLDFSPDSKPPVDSGDRVIMLGGNEVLISSSGRVLVTPDSD